MPPSRKEAPKEAPALNGRADASVSDDETSDQALDISDMIKLDPRGNVIFVLANKKKFLCSSHTLSQTSTFFRAMFTGEWPEAVKLRNGETIIVNLKDDHADSMEMILGILHHEVPDMSHVEKDLVARFHLAVCSDFYDFNHALKWWINKHWLPNIRNIGRLKSLTAAEAKAETPLDLGLILAILFLFKDKRLPKVAVKVAAIWKPDWLAEWEKEGIIQYLPDRFIEALDDYAKACLDNIATHVEKFHKSLNHSYNEIVLNPLVPFWEKFGYSRCDGAAYSHQDDRLGLVQHLFITDCVDCEWLDDWWKWTTWNAQSLLCQLKAGTIAEVEGRFNAARSLLVPHQCSDGQHCYLGKVAKTLLDDVAEELDKFRRGSVTGGLTWL